MKHRAVAIIKINLELLIKFLDFSLCILLLLKQNGLLNWTKEIWQNESAVVSKVAYKNFITAIRIF
jgi:hypothetical protein